MLLRQIREELDRRSRWYPLETFYTDGEAATYGDGTALGTLADSLDGDKCCLPKAAA
jgi:hypothetical protein